LAEIVLCCGKVCSGKSTFTKMLENKYKYYTFSADEWMLQLYKETEDRSLFDDNLSRCTELIYQVSEKILKNNNENKIALDFGFWKRENRNALRKRFSSQGFSVTLLYFPIEFEQQILYMNNRQSDLRSKHYHFNDDTIKTLNKFFEEPDISENYKNKEEYLDTLSKKIFS
jgi:predicted kinase